MECFLCGVIKQPTKEAKAPCFSCDACKNFVCMECSELSASELKCMPLQKRVMRFYCRKCRNNEFVESLQYIIKDKEIIVDDKNKIISMLQEKLRMYEQVEDCKLTARTFAGAVKGNQETAIVPKPQNVPDVVIKPKNAQDSKRTRDDIISNINPADLKIGIRNLVTTRSGSVVIKCKSKKEAEVLQNIARDRLEDSYTVETSKMRKPRVRITNFGQDLTREEIEASILQQNEGLKDFRVTYTRRGRNGQNTVFGECSPSTFRQLMQVNKVFIGWERFPVYEDLSVPRCFQCQGFYHKKQDCRKKLVCPLCSEEHEQRDCPGQKKVCINCVSSNGRFRLKNNTDHHSTDLRCPTLQYQINLLKNKIDYSTEW